MRLVPALVWCVARRSPRPLAVVPVTSVLS